MFKSRTKPSLRPTNNVPSAGLLEKLLPGFPFLAFSGTGGAGAQGAGTSLLDSVGRSTLFLDAILTSMGQST